jgi:Flp pilus assembly protein TadG
MAILFPVMLLMVLGLFQMSLYWHTSNVVAVAAEQGLNAGQVHADDHGLARSEAVAAAQAILATTTHRDPVITPVIVGGDRLQVTVSAQSPVVIGIGVWTVESVAEGRLEEFVPVTER